MLRLLLVERDPALAWLYKEELEEAGFKVRVSDGLNSARAALRDQPAHLLVGDINSLGPCLELSLPRLREVHSGPMLLLGSVGKGRGRRLGLPVVGKSSDLKPLISTLRKQALPFLWSHSASASC